MKKLEVGQTVWLEFHGNRSRLTKGYRESKITKVGRDYVYTIEGKFSKETGWQVSAYTPDFKLWVSLEDLSNHQEKQKLYDEVSSMFKFIDCPLTLDQLRAINSIINPH